MTERQQLISQRVDAVRETILKAERWLWANPQTGYREWKAHSYLAERFEALGYELTLAGNIPGFYTDLDTGLPGPKLMILGELDSLICAEHPDADPETGAVHCCGHHAQGATLLGIAAALRQPGALEGLSGSIRLCAVPAEELIEIDFRRELIEQGLIRYPGGKAEFLSRGHFDGVDLAFMVHVNNGDTFFSRFGHVGCLAKQIVFQGKAAHAGSRPWEGCNALYAATLGLQAINSLRETFQEKDQIRVHPIITQGGNAVNAIPDRVVLESFVRGNNFDAIHQVNAKVNRALCGAALAMGANVSIQDIPGYAPNINNAGLIQVAREAAQIAPEIPFVHQDAYGTGSTDMGDLSCVMPTIHPYVPGASGTSHGADFQIENPELACILSAKWQLAMAELLLENGAARTKEIVDAFQPRFTTKEDYCRFLDSLFSSGERIAYADNGTATVTL